MKLEQFEFGFAAAVTVVKEWVRPAVMVFKPFNADGSKSKRVTLQDWLCWHAPLGNRGVR